MSDLDPRQLLEMAQKGELYDEELTHLLNGLDIADLSSLADFTVKYARQKPISFYNSSIDLNDIKCSSIAFHKKAGTDTQKVISNINNLTSGSLRLRVAHQANLFPSLAVAGQVFLMDALAQ